MLKTVSTQTCAFINTAQNLIKPNSLYEHSIMSELDYLIGNKISLVSQGDIKYEGVLFSINAQDSSIVLQQGT